MPNVLLPGDVMHVNDTLTSPNGRFILLYQPDGNLVIYDTADIVPNVPGRAIWQTATEGNAPSAVSLDTGGNFVMFGVGAANKLWETGTSQPTRRGLSVVLQDDGNLVLYGVTPLFTSFSDRGLIGRGGAIPPPPPVPVEPNGVGNPSVWQDVNAAVNELNNIVAAGKALVSFLDVAL